jgi:hypothetical protein
MGVGLVVALAAAFVWGLGLGLLAVGLGQCA